MKLTPPQRRCLEILVKRKRVVPWEMAMEMWPDSPGWNRRSRRSSTPAGGALGATMPMKAATLLWRLHRKGLANLEGHNRWSPTRSGEAEAAR